MDQLPQELHDQICGHLPLEDLRIVSYVSTKFRKSAEDQAEKHKSYSCEINNEKDRKEFVARYSGFRIRLLENIHYEIILPGPDICPPDFDGYPHGCCESTEERHRRDTAFTEQVRTMLETLKTVEDCSGSRNSGRYRVKIEVTSDMEQKFEYCQHRQYAQWRTCLLEPNGHPQVMSATSLCVMTENSWAKLDYRVMIDIARCLPNLEYLECSFGGDEWTPPFEEEEASLFPWEYDGPRRDSRHDFGKSIELFTAPALREADLNFLYRIDASCAEDIHHWKTMPDLVSPLSRDPFSSSIRIMSYHLRQLSLRAQVDDSLFWPGGGSTPHWPHLENIYLLFHLVSPSGAWYFEGPRGEGRDLVGYEVNETRYPPRTEEDVTTDCTVDYWENPRSFEGWGDYQFRISPNEAVLVPFLNSFAKAAALMPKLKQAVLWSPLRFSPSGDTDIELHFDYYSPPYQFYSNYVAWGFAYEAPGMRWPFSGKQEDKNCKVRRIWWRVGQWRPDEELHAAFRQIGSHGVEEDMEEDWFDEKYGSALVTRDYFDIYTPDHCH